MKAQARWITTLFLASQIIAARAAEGPLPAPTAPSGSALARGIRDNSLIDDIAKDLKERLLGFTRLDLSLLSLSAATSSSQYSLSFYNDNDDSSVVDIYPSAIGGYHGAIDYNGLSLLGGAEQYGSDPGSFGVVTSHVDFQAFYSTGFLGLELRYQRYRGFFSGNLPPEAASAYPDLELDTMEANAYVKLFGNASLKELSEPEEIVKRGFIGFAAWAMPSYTRRSLRSPESLIPASRATQHPSIAALDSLDANILSCSLGIMAPMHLLGLYFMPAFSYGVGFPFLTSNVPLEKVLAAKFTQNLQLGLSSRHLSLGVYFNMDESMVTSFASRENIGFHSMSFGGFAGIRL
jgi:hypothetical protein